MVIYNSIETIYLFDITQQCFSLGFVGVCGAQTNTANICVYVLFISTFTIEHIKYMLQDRLQRLQLGYCVTKA
jgi:uncharacterized membrane protein YtjA (UPF0391 family)